MKNTKVNYRKLQKEVKTVATNEIEHLVLTFGDIRLGTTPDTEFGICHNGSAYVPVEAVTNLLGEAVLVTENEFVKFGNISADEVVELHDIIFERMGEIKFE